MEGWSIEKKSKKVGSALGGLTEGQCSPCACPNHPAVAFHHCPDVSQLSPGLKEIRLVFAPINLIWVLIELVSLEYHCVLGVFLSWEAI